MPTKAEMEAQAALEARQKEQAAKLRQLHRDTRVPDPAKVAKLKKTYERDGKVNTFTLDYLGHADTTDLLLAHDPHWNWEPLAWAEDGTPKVDRDSKGWARGLWIKLTIHGVTRLGYGSCEAGKSDAVKELIGDAIRNAALRFGVALQLWSKADAAGWGDLPDVPDDEPPPGPQGPPEAPQAPAPPPAAEAPQAPAQAPEEAPQPPPAEPPAAVNEPLTPEAAGDLDRDGLEAAVFERLKAVRGDMAKNYANARRANDWPADLTAASDDQLRAILAFFAGTTTDRVVAGTGS